MVTGGPISDADLATLHALYVDHHARLARLARLLGAGDPEDVVQDAFVRLSGKPRHFTSPHASAYLQRIVVNLIRDRHTAARRLHPVPNPAAGQVDPHDDSVTAQLTLDTALRALSPRHREAIVLRYWLDLSLQQAATVMGVSVGTAKSHLSRAISTLRSQLGEDAS